MWRAETRRIYDRKGLRYPTDMTDPEWELACPFIDVPQRGSGRQRRVDLREVLNAVFYLLGTALDCNSDRQLASRGAYLLLIGQPNRDGASASPNDAARLGPAALRLSARYGGVGRLRACRIGCRR